jgi:hypothetical protein
MIDGIARNPRGSSRMAGVALSRRDFVASAAASLMLAGCAKAAVPAGTGVVKVPPDFFGIHVNNASPNGLWKQNETPLPDIGARAIRLWDSGTSWRALNPAPGAFDFSRLDYRVETARAKGLEVMLTLGQAPDWAASSQGPTLQTNPNPPRRIEDWNAYVEAVAGRYSDRINYYEIWNEPDLIEGYNGSVQGLLELAQSAHTIIKRRAPGAKVMTPAFSVPFHGRFSGACNLKNWVEAGGLRFCDAVSVHAYPGDGLEPERVLEWLGVVRELLDQHGMGHLPVYDTESGGRGWRDERGMLHNIPASGFNDPLPTHPVDLQSAWVTRQLLCTAMSGLRQSYYYTFDNPSGRARTRSVMAVHMTDYPENPRRLFAPATAYRYLSGLMAGAELSEFISTGKHFSINMKSVDGRRATVHWTGDFGSGDVPLRLGSTVFDNLGNRVPTRGTLHIGASPLFVFEA